MNLYDTAIKIWIARKVSTRHYHLDAEDITSYSFGDGHTGACETCWEEFVALIYTTNKDKHTHYIELEDISPVEMLEQCIEIYKTLSHL